MLQSNARAYSFFAALFVTTLIVSNIIAVKIGDFMGHFLPVAVLLFPVSYIIGDILTEVYGYNAARRVIWTGFICNLLAVFIIWLGLIMPAAPFFQDQDAFAKIFAMSPRILAASFAAYLVGEFTNSFVLAKLKIKTNGKHLWMRTIGSTIVGEGLDSAIFLTLAFWGIFPLPALGVMILSQWVFKVGFEVLFTPLTYLIVGYVKKKEGIDVYDHNTNFNPLSLDHANE